MKQMINGKVKLHTVFSTDSFYFVSKCIFNEIDVYDELQQKGYASKESSSSEKSNSPPKNKTKALKTHEKFEVLSNSKAMPQHNSNQKGIVRSPKSSVDGTFKTAATFPKQSTRQPKKEFCEELETLQLKNDKLAKELLAEKEKSKALKLELETLKAKTEASHFEKLDSVILKTRQLFAMRNQRAYEDPSNLEEIFDTIKTKLHCDTQPDNEQLVLHSNVEEALSKYKDLVECIGTFDQADIVMDHIEDRDKACQAASDLMKEYLESWNGDYLTEKVACLKKLLLKMEQRYDRYMKMDVKCDKSLDELINEYRENNVKDRTSMEMLVKNTNDVLEHFSTIIADLQKDITLPSDETKEPADICVRFTKAAFIESLKEVQEAVDTEIVAETTQPRSPVNETLMAALIKVLIKEVQVPLETTLQEIEDCRKYNLLYPDLCHNLASKPDTSKVYDIRKEIKTLKSKIRHKLADKKDLEESDDLNAEALQEINSALDVLLHQLHAHFREEHDELMKLASAYKAHFRELNILHPDLNLSSYSNCDGLLKENWEMEHFNYCSIAGRPGICYSAKFSNEPVVIKEYHLNAEKYEQFFKKILLWHSLSEQIVQVHGVFRSKTGFQTYAMFPHYMTLEESEKVSPFGQNYAGQLLHGILKGLASIHSQGISHSLLNPSTILIRPDTSAPTPLLDFCFAWSPTTDVWESKGIVFSSPEKRFTQASDMYSFGCLILWMLFPNLQFTSTSSGILHIAGYKSIVQGLLSVRGYEAVESLLSVKPSSRPNAKSLLEKDIFGELACNSNDGDDPSCTSVPESQSMEELSLDVSNEESPAVAMPDELLGTACLAMPDELLGTACLAKPDELLGTACRAKPDELLGTASLAMPDELLDTACPSDT